MASNCTFAATSADRFLCIGFDDITPGLIPRIVVDLSEKMIDGTMLELLTILLGPFGLRYFLSSK